MFLPSLVILVAHAVEHFLQDLAVEGNKIWAQWQMMCWGSYMGVEKEVKSKKGNLEIWKLDMVKAQITLPLEIPDVRVLKTEIDSAGEVIITVESMKKETRC
jgi:hypothetical protein